MRALARVVVPAALLGLLLTACGGQDTSDPTPLPPSATLPSSPDSASGSDSATESDSAAPSSTSSAPANDALVRESALRIAQTYMGYAAEEARKAQGDGEGEDLFAYLRDNASAWETAAADLATEAALTGLTATVDGVAAESVTAGSLTVSEGLLVGVSDGTTECVVEATFIQAGSVVSMAWAGPTCTSSAQSTAASGSATPSGSPSAE